MDKRYQVMRERFERVNAVGFSSSIISCFVFSDFELDVRSRKRTNAIWSLRTPKSGKSKKKMSV